MKRYSLILLLITLIICLLTACTVSATTDTSTDAIGTTLPEVSDTSSYADDSSSLAKTSDSSETETPNTSTDTPITSSETPDTTVQTPPTSDPYVNVSKNEFYQNYTPATSLADALYRSQHGFMSGSIDLQDQAPTISTNQPKENGLFIRNTSTLYGDDGNSYSIVNAHGEIVNTIYKGGGYVSLEEVAAYVYAFGDIPANYLAKKNAKPASNIWGEYLRLNHTKFSGDTSRYRYEPELPRISGCGGDYYYYEIDIGTTGTDCDPAYRPAIYNNGSFITRGAARIVYSRFDINNNKIIDPNEKFVFYTYNHYNDFQEYLNYEGGWGEMFGNITGGGKISSNSNCNPTPYVKTAYRDFTNSATVIAFPIDSILYYDFRTKKAA